MEKIDAVLKATATTTMFFAFWSAHHAFYEMNNDDLWILMPLHIACIVFIVIKGVAK